MVRCVLLRCSRMLPSIRVLNDFVAGGRGILLRQNYLRHHVDLILVLHVQRGLM